jgi:hypothetical protein
MIDADSAIKTIPYATDVSYILPDPKEILIGDIDKIEFHKDKLYILDRKDKSIFIINNQGRLIKKIHNVGRGPGEYQEIFDFSTDSKNEKIVVGVPLKIQYYDLNGNFIEEHNQDDYFVSFACDTSGILHSFSSKDQNEGYPMQNWSVFSQIKDSVTAVGFPFPSLKHKDILPPLDQIAFKNSNREVLIRQHWTDSIFHITSNSTYSLHAYLQVESGQSRLEKTHNIKGSQEEANNLINTSFFLSKFLETSNSIFGAYTTPDALYIDYLINKKTGVQYHINNFISVCGIGVNNNSLLLTSILHHPMFISNDDRFVGYFWPYELETLYKQYKEDVFYLEDETLIKYFENFDLNGNPLIVAYKIEFRDFGK